MRRRLVFLLLLILSIVLGLWEHKPITFFELLILPLTITGNFLRMLSLSSVFGNTLSVVLYVILIFTPLSCFLFLNKKNKKNKQIKLDIVFVLIITVIFSYTLYQFINPHILLEKINPILLNNMGDNELDDLKVIFLSGLASILYLTVLIYFFVKLYLSNKLKSVKMFCYLSDLVIVIILMSFGGIELSKSYELFSQATNGYETMQIVLSFGSTFVIYALTIYLLEIVRIVIIELNKDGFNDRLLVYITKMYKISFILFIFIMITLIINNLYQLIFIQKLTKINFNLHIPVTILLLSILIFILSKYVTRVNKLNKDHSLII